MAFYQYVNDKHALAQVVVNGDKLDEVPRNDFKLFVARPEEEMEIYAKDHPQGPRRLVESSTLRELVSRVRPM
jgi:hypothetical protein